MSAPTVADLLDVHTAGERDPAGWPRCEACGFRWPCPDLRNALPAQTADEMEVVALVDVGWSIWRARPGGRDTWNDCPDDGGTVVSWWDQPNDDDQSTLRIFRCVDFPKGRHRFHALPASDVDVNACSLPNASTLRSHSRRLAREYSQRKGTITQYDLEVLETALTLVRCVA